MFRWPSRLASVGALTIALAVGMWGINQNDRLQWKIKKDASEGASF